MTPIKRISTTALALTALAIVAILLAPALADRYHVFAGSSQELQQQLDRLAPQFQPRVAPAGPAASVVPGHSLTVAQLNAALALAGAPAPDQARLTQLVRDLEAVAAPTFDLPAAGEPLLAAPGAETDTAATDLEVAEAEEEGEAAPAEDQAANVPEPPGKRLEMPVVSSGDSNASIASMQHAIDRTAEAGHDLLAARGLLNAGSATGPTGDPMGQLVDVDFRELQLSNALALLAHKAGINIISSVALDAPVTVFLRDVPLRQAIRTTLRSQELGLIEEEGIYQVVPYKESLAAERTTVMIAVENADAADLATVVTELVKGTDAQGLVNVTTNDKANILVINGPKRNLDEIVPVITELDVAEQVLPTVTEAIKLNYSEPTELLELVKSMLTPETGTVGADARARHLVVTDVPAVVEQVRDLVASLDMPVKRVLIEAMVVDAVLGDAADTGVDWILQTLRSQSRRDAGLGNNVMTGNLQQLDLESNLGVGDVAGLLSFGVLTDHFDWRGVIQAEVRNTDSRLVSTPWLHTLENKPATITIAQDLPYVEVKQSEAGGSQTNTEFKEIGTVLTVTPRVTHDNNVIVEIQGKESGSSGVFNDVPIEDRREIDTTARMKSGQTIYVGGLRKNDQDTTVRKLPILGDVPGLNVLFRSNTRSEQVSELLIFLTCTVIDENDAPLTAYQQEKYDEGKAEEMKVDAQRAVLRTIAHPNETRDPVWKWRRAED